ncbi:MAG: hypothetical protein HN396_16870 [Gemmatimonadales bacterium]|jgi:hypothetical protein|nr:hypothetical protein [Gemmatimonadales bacterium]
MPTMQEHAEVARRWGREAGERYAKGPQAGEPVDYWKFRAERRQEWLDAEFDGGEPPAGAVDGTEAGDGLYYTYNLAHNDTAMARPVID